MSKMIIHQMNTQLLQWVYANIGKTFVSPRKSIFGRNPYDFIIKKVDEENECLRIEFIKGNSVALPLYFSMFDRVLNYLMMAPSLTYPIGARIQPPYPKESIEGEIWREPKLYSSNYKAAPHILDVLALCGFVEYGYTRSRENGRRVQGAKFNSDINYEDRPPIPEDSNKQENLSPDEPLSSSQEIFIRQHRDIVIEWAEENRNNIVDSRLQYSWKNRSRLECEQSRNEVSKDIIASRIINGGGVDLATLDRIIKWGFNRRYPDRDQEKALDITTRAFDYLCRGDIKQATMELLDVGGIGISRASKILGLFDQENLCIYDSRVGTALKTLEKDGERLILIPPSQVREGDLNIKDEEWANHYERLIWTIRIIRDYLNSTGCTYRSADVEMALFMMGK